MDNKLTITIRVAGKILNPTINRSDEEIIRKAAKLLDNKYSEYKNQIENPFDCLLLSALQTSIAQMNNESKITDSTIINKNIIEIDNILTEHIQNVTKK